MVDPDGAAARDRGPARRGSASRGAPPAASAGPPGRRVAPEPGRDRGLVERLRQVDPGSLGQADQRRRRRARPRRRRLGERRPGHVQRDRAPRLEDEAAVHPPSTVGSCSAHRIVGAGPGQLVEQVGHRRRCPAGSSWAVGSSRTRTLGAHRDDARDRHPLLLAAGQRERLAVGEVADRQAVERRHRSARPSRRAACPGSRARTRAPRGRSASTPTAGWPGSRRRSRPGRAARSARRSPCRRLRSTTAPVELGPDDARDEPGGGERQGRLAGARPAGDADALAAADGQVDAARGSARGDPDSGRRGPRSGAVARRRPLCAASSAVAVTGR